MASARAWSFVCAAVAVGFCVPPVAGLVRSTGLSWACFVAAGVAAFWWGWLSEVARDARGGDRDA